MSAPAEVGAGRTAHEANARLRGVLAAFNDADAVFDFLPTGQGKPRTSDRPVMMPSDMSPDFLLEVKWHMYGCFSTRGLALHPAAYCGAPV